MPAFLESDSDLLFFTWIRVGVWGWGFGLFRMEIALCIKKMVA